MVRSSSISAIHVEEVARQRVEHAFLALALSESGFDVEGGWRARQLLVDGKDFVQVDYLLGPFVLDLDHIWLLAETRV